MLRIFITAFVTLFIWPVSSFALENIVEHKLSNNSLFQVSTIGALAQGVYDGDYSYQSLMAMATPHTIGVGTFQKLNGEMTAIDGQFYQIRANGQLNVVTPQELTPFVEIANISLDKSIKLVNVNDYQSLQQLLVKNFPDRNIPYAIRIDGKFNIVKLRDVKEQHKPYPTLQIATKDESLFQLSQVQGSVVGFWFPSYWERIGVPGFHLHFVTTDKKMGGHILEISIRYATLYVTPIHNVSIYLPRNKEFSEADLTDKSINEEIQTSEGDRKK
jgi:acetolactate decarboxylase